MLRLTALLLIFYLSFTPAFAEEFNHENDNDDDHDHFHASDINDFIDEPNGVGGDNDIQLKSAIEQKTQELKEIHQQLQETQDKLVETENKTQNLSRTISTNNYRISQLQLSLKSNKITIDKLGLEIESLGGDISTTQELIALKNQAIYKILREMQVKEDESLLVAFLKNQSLAESLKEIQDLTDSRQALALEIKELKGLKDNLDQTLTQVAQNKNGIEQQYKNSSVQKVVLEEKTIENKELLALTKNQAEEYEQQIDELAERQARIAEEIEEIEANLRKQINTDLLPPERPGVLGWPVDQGWKNITQVYGATEFARYAYKGKWHNGLDIGGPIGTPLLAAGEGIVFSVGDQDKYCRRGAYGKYVVVKLNNNLTTLYAHLSNIAVDVGTRVQRGDVIGYMGSTGYSTGSHLHFSIYDSNTFKMSQSRSCGPMPTGGDINPSKYL